MPLADNSVDLVLTSPPYLTRIDYAVAYMRELAVLGVNVRTDRRIRTELMGTTVIREQEAGAVCPLGEIAQKLVEKVSQHDSYASGVYYLKQARQYLTDLTESLGEITRVTKPGGIMHLVVQDSYYKDVPVPLADICIEESCMRGWTEIKRNPYPVKRTLVALNTAAQNYAKGAIDETVITMQKD
jgi:DNA modification methylase